MKSLPELIFPCVAFLGGRVCGLQRKIRKNVWIFWWSCPQKPKYARSWFHSLCTGKMLRIHERVPLWHNHASWLRTHRSIINTCGSKDCLQLLDKLKYTACQQLKTSLLYKIMLCHCFGQYSVSVAKRIAFLAPKYKNGCFSHKVWPLTARYILNQHGNQGWFLARNSNN